MPNHCHNRVTFYAKHTEIAVAQGHCKADQADIRGRELLWSDHTRTRLG